MIMDIHEQALSMIDSVTAGGDKLMWRHDACDLVEKALKTVPFGYCLVPSDPTDSMIDAAKEAYCPFGDMEFAILAAIRNGDNVNKE